jgi:hypothetical protein
VPGVLQGCRKGPSVRLNFNKLRPSRYLSRQRSRVRSPVVPAMILKILESSDPKKQGPGFDTGARSILNSHSKVGFILILTQIRNHPCSFALCGTFVRGYCRRVHLQRDPAVGVHQEHPVRSSHLRRSPSAMCRMGDGKCANRFSSVSSRNGTDMMLHEIVRPKRLLAVHRFAREYIIVVGISALATSA